MNNNIDINRLKNDEEYLDELFYNTDFEKNWLKEHIHEYLPDCMKVVIYEPYILVLDRYEYEPNYSKHKILCSINETKGILNHKLALGIVRYFYDEYRIDINEYIDHFKYLFDDYYIIEHIFVQDEKNDTDLNRSETTTIPFNAPLFDESWNKNPITGKKLNTTFRVELKLAEKIGLDAITDTYYRAKAKWQNDVENMAEITHILYWAFKDYFETNYNYSELYYMLLCDCQNFCLRHFKYDELKKYKDLRRKYI